MLATSTILVHIKYNTMGDYKSLEEIQEVCKKYQTDEKCVYKRCNNGVGTQRKWLVIMEKCDDTVTNEDRKNVVEKKYAKFRANKLKVVEIINTINGISEDQIVNVSDHGFPLLYKVGSVVECDEFNKNIDVVCGGGIHYFKTFIAAYYYDYSIFEHWYSGKWLSWYDNGRIQYESFFNNGILNGSWKTFCENGSVCCDEKEYKDGLLNGTRTVRYINGDKQLEENYDLGHLEGSYTKWYQNGEKREEGFYESGTKNGLWTIWFSNGKKNKEGRYKNREKSGIWTIWYVGGKKHKQIQYRNGKKDGLWEKWYQNDQTSKKGEYENGKKEGLWTEWHQNGQKSSEGIYIKGDKSGSWTEWNQDGDVL